MSVVARQKQTQDRNLERLLTMEVGRPDYNAWAHAVSMYQALPGLRAFWPMSSVAYTNPQAIDASNQTNHLTNNNVATFGYSSLIPHATFNGTTQYLGRADGGVANWADLVGNEGYVDAADRGVTIGGWFEPSAAVSMGVMVKGAATVNDAYWLYTVNQNMRFAVWNGGAVTWIASTVVYAANNWYFWAGRYVPSTSVDIFQNGTKSTNAVGVPATITDSVHPFAIGSNGGGVAPFYGGKASLCFLCACQLSDAIIAALFEQSRALFGV